MFARQTAAMHAEAPPESIHMMGAAELGCANIDFFVMRDHARVIGMAAIKRVDDRHVEIKSMHIFAEARGRGLARQMLGHPAGAARTAGCLRLSLETGVQPGFQKARSLYARAGFRACGPFGGYREDPNSVFMTKDLE